MYLFKVEILEIKKKLMKLIFLKPKYWRIQMYEDRIIHTIRKTKELIALNKFLTILIFL